MRFVVRVRLRGFRKVVFESHLLFEVREDALDREPPRREGVFAGVDFRPFVCVRV